MSSIALVSSTVFVDFLGLDWIWIGLDWIDLGIKVKG